MSIRVSQPAINLREKLIETTTPPIGAHGSELMDSSSVGESFDLVKAGRKNMIINGDMQIAQRATTASGFNGSPNWVFSTVDRWKLGMSGAGTWTSSQDTDVPIGQGFTKSWKLDCTTADAAVDSGDYFLLEQKIEANRMAELCWGTARAKPVTLSFWVKSSVTGDCNGMLYCPGFNTLRIVNQNFTIHNANEWEFKTMTFPAHGPENSFTINNAAGARLWIWFKAGSQWTAGSGTRNYWRNNAHNQQAPGTTINIASSTSNNLWITGVQFEVGYNATPFEFKSYADQLYDCMRYYEGIKMGIGTALFRTWTNTAGSPTNVSNVEYNFKVEKRVSPTWAVEGNASWHPSGTSGMSAYPSTSTCLFQRNDTTHQFLSDTSGDLCGSFSAEL